MEEKIIQQIVHKLQDHDARFDKQDEILDMLAKRLLNHEDRLERIEHNMATKADFDVIMKAMDEVLGIVKKTDQEVVMLGSRLSRLEQRHEEDIREMNKRLY